MPKYTYVAINRAGKQVKELVDANSIETAKSSLRATGYTVLSIQELSKARQPLNVSFLGNPKNKDKAVFCRQFLSILRAGVPVTKVLEMLTQQTENDKLQQAIREMQADVEKGSTLANAMAKHNKIFPRMLTSMVAAGEESGNLEAAFAQMETYFNKATKTKNAIVKAMIYPIILMVVMVVVLIVMVTRIVPRFISVFEQMDAELPGPTKAVIAFTNWFQASAGWLVLGLIVLIVAGVMFRRTDKGKHFFGWLTMHIPVVKLLSIRSNCATFCRTLSLLLSSGLNLPESLEMTAENQRNIHFEDAVNSARAFVTQGLSLNGALRNTGIFPPMVYNMVGIGEESGDLEGMMRKAADYYDDEVEQATQRLLGLMEPITILFMAVLVVFIVLSIFLPMLNMTKAYDQYLNM